MSAASAPLYNKFTITKGKGEPVGFAKKVVSFEYFESLYSPTVTANIAILEAGNSSKEKLNLSGNEKVEFIVEHSSGTLKFDRKNALRVNGAPTVLRESNRESVLLPLVSNYEIQNKGTPVFDKYANLSIMESAAKILEKKLNVPKSDINKWKGSSQLEKTRNTYDFIGKGKSAFEIITKLARKSLPVKGDPGFFFYETQDGFNYRSVTSLIKQEVKETYTYSGGLKANLNNDANDYKILTQPTFVKDQNVTKALESGTYVSRNVFFNPYNHEYIERIYKIDEKGVTETCGTDFKLDPELKDKSFVKTNFHVLDIGSLQVGISTDINNTPSAWAAKSTMRYNLLHSQVMTIQVPCNLNLRAGDTIKCQIETISTDKVNNAFDTQQSGKYLILHLCHHFDSSSAYTSLTLVRDTYGLHTGKK